MERQNLDEPFYGGARFGGMPVFRAGRFVYFKVLRQLTEQRYLTELYIKGY